MRLSYCTIYLIKNTENNKMYVGQTWEKLERRFSKHKSNKECIKLKRAFEKYGTDKFSIEALAATSSQETANYLEIIFIKLFNCIELGYNIKEGGSNGKLSQSSKDKISASNTGKIRTQEVKNRISQSRKGIRNRTKLNMILVSQIRSEYATGQWTYLQLAKKYNVEQSNIGMIIRNKIWIS